MSGKYEKHRVRADGDLLQGTSSGAQQYCDVDQVTLPHKFVSNF